MTNKEHALSYLEIGFSIFPTRGKKPLIAWERYQSEKPTEQQIIEWWDKWLDADIATVTGVISGIVVVDIDGGEVPQLPPTAVSETSSGHYQYFFKHPGFSVQNSVKVIAPNIDVRADGGFVVLPPSRHFNKETKKQDFTYTWKISLEEGSFADLPQWVLDKVKSKKPLEDIIKGVTEGSRNNDAASLIGSFLAKYPQEQWESMCWPMVASWNQTKNKPPLSEVELRAIFNSISLREITKKTQELPIYSDSFLSSVPKLISELTENQSKVDWVWEGFLAKGHLTFFSALWKVGKSTLISYLLKAIQEKKEFAGLPTILTKVLILSEESETIWARRREDLELVGDIYLHCRPTKIKLDTKQWLTLLEYELKFCTDNGIELFVIDTISTFWPVKDEGNNPEIDAALLSFNLFLEKNICVMPIHHFRKSGGSEGTATRGGGGIGSRADILIEYTRLDAQNPNGTQRVLRSYSRFEETPPELVVDLVDDEFIPRGTRSEVSKEAKMQNVLRILEEQPNSTIKEIAEAWDIETLGSKPVTRTIRNYIDELLKDGRVNQTGKKIVGKTEAPAYSLIELAQEKKDSSYIDVSIDKEVDNLSAEGIEGVFEEVV